jgi:hypothetical protein
MKIEINLPRSAQSADRGCPISPCRFAPARRSQPIASAPRMALRRQLNEMKHIP